MSMYDYSRLWVKSRPIISKWPCYINDLIILRVLFVNNVQERLRSLYISPGTNQMFLGENISRLYGLSIFLKSGSL